MQDVNGAPMKADELSSEEMRELLDKTREIHAFVKGVAEALNNPMIKSMLPPNMRGMV